MINMKIRRNHNIAMIILFLCAMFPGDIIAQNDLPTLVKKIQPSVVMIITYDEKDSALLYGTGFFINAKGDIISNRHVFMGAKKGVIKTAKGQIYPIKRYLAEDIDGDLLMVSVEIPKEFVHPLSVSTVVPEVGEKIIVIGNPVGFEQTVTDGIVSAVRAIKDFGNIIQISAPISHGSSGSPVINMKGNVIGIATLMILNGQNLAFAIPSERVAKLKPDSLKITNEWNTIGDSSITAADDLFVKANYFILAEDYVNALAFYKEAVKINPFLFKAFCQIGFYNELVFQNYTESINAYKQALKLKPDYEPALVGLGIAHLSLYKYQEAAEYLNKAIKINPTKAATYSILGDSYISLKKYKEAIAVYKIAINIDSSKASTYYYNRIGIAYEALNLYLKAIESYKQAIRIDPDDAHNHLSLGVAYSALKRYPEAIEAYKQAIILNPRSTAANESLGLAYKSLKMYKEAIEAFQQANALDPILAKFADSNYYNQGLTYLLLGDKNAALEQYKTLKDINKDLAQKLFDFIYK